MLTMTARQVHDRIERAMAGVADREVLATRLYGALVRAVPFDFACLATMDPASGLITWASKSRPLNIGDQEFAQAEYGPPDINKFEEIARRHPPVAVLSIDTDGDPDVCRRHREYMRPQFGFTDELRAVLMSKGVTWGALALYRGPGEPAFTTPDAAMVAGITDLVAVAIQRSLFTTGAASPETGDAPELDDAHGPAVMIVGGDDRVSQMTASARGLIDELGGWDHGALPANVLAVVAGARNRADGHVTTRTRGVTGQWISLRASSLDDGSPTTQDVVVTFESTPRATLSRLALAAHGLTSREEEVSLLVLQGVDTKGIASALHLSPHTVQDHLKSVFVKTGVTSRRELTAKLILR